MKLIVVAFFYVGVGVLGQGDGSTMTMVSEKCDSETRLLNNNTALQERAPILECNINFDITDNCTVDYEAVSMNYSTACIDAGGQYYTTDIFLNCMVALGGTTFIGKSYYNNTPSCLGKSCTGSEIEMEFEANLYPKLEESYSQRGAQCEISKNDGSSSSRDSKPISRLITVPLMVIAVTTILLSLC